MGAGGTLARVGVGSDGVSVGLSATAVAAVADVVVGALGAGDGAPAGLLQATRMRAEVAARITIHLLGRAIVRLPSPDRLRCLHQGSADDQMYHSGQGDNTSCHDYSLLSRSVRCVFPALSWRVLTRSSMPRLQAAMSSYVAAQSEPVSRIRDGHTTSSARVRC